MNVRVKAKKILSPMSAFSLVNAQGLPQPFSGILKPEQEAVGFYENSTDDLVVIAIDGLCIIKGNEHSFVGFETIDKVVLLDENKNDARSLELKLKDGTSKSLTIEHGNGRFRDIFEFVRFLKRVLL